MSLIRGTLVSFAGGLAAVRLDGSAPQTIENIAVSPGLPPGELVAGRTVILDTGQTGELADLVLLAVGSGASALFDGVASALTAAASAAGASLVAARRDHVHGEGLITTKGDLMHFAAAPARLAVGADGLVLVADSAQAAGLKWAATGGALARAASALDVVNTIVETSLFSFSVPANTLGTDRLLRLTLFGDYLNNAGFNRAVTLKAKYGATTLFNDLAGAIASSGFRRPFRFDVELANQGATNAQVLSGMIALGLPGGTTSGLGDLSGLPWLVNHIFGTSVEDSTAAKTLELTATHSAAAATISIRRQYACLELV